MNVKNRNPTPVDLEQRLSPHFTLGEMLRSGTAIQLNIDNMPGKNPSPFEPSYDDVIENLKALAVNVLEPLRQRVGRVIITSGYRCQQLNEAVGGVANSQYLRGEAADIHFTTPEIRDKYIRVLLKTNFDQIILEPVNQPVKRWIHVSYKRSGGNRHKFINHR